MKLGKIALFVRESQGLTQRAAAELLDISPVYLCNIEKDKATPSHELIDRYRELWGVDLYVFAWCIRGETDCLPENVRESAKALSDAWQSQLGDQLENWKG